MGSRGIERCAICGIAGFYAPGEPIGPWFSQATAAAHHRGPDEDGIWARGWVERHHLDDVSQGSAPSGHSVALGFQRLAILDLSPKGNQPQVAPGRAAIVFNGEIYNYVELRDELRGKGWTFASSGDAEVLLNGWLEWREGILERLNGMWAIAIYDFEHDRLILSRDRFGEKPLFWAEWRSGVAFASEVKQLKVFPDLPIRLNASRAAAYLRTGRPYHGASSWFDRVHQIEPGTLLCIDPSGRSVSRYWDLRASVGKVVRSADAAGWQERFAHAFTHSVRLRLRSDVPVGTSLSAGVDSSAVMAEATALGHRGYHSFTVTSDDPAIDEGPAAGAFAQAMGSTWHPVRVSGNDFAEDWDRLTWHQEAPVPTTSQYGQWKVMEAARAAGVIVLLDGQGADEILGGYHKFAASELLARFRSLDPSTASFAWAFARHLGGARTIREAGYHYLGRLGGSPDLSDWIRATPDMDRPAPSIRAGVHVMQVADIERWSLPNLLSYVDRSAMAFGVETRLPYLDPEVATLALAMPTDVLMRNGWSKWPLRKSLADRTDRGPAWRRGKLWFGVPQRAWLRGPLAPQIDEWRTAPHALWSDVVDVNAMRRFGDAWAGRRTSSAAMDDTIFTLVAMDRFLRVWFSR